MAAGDQGASEVMPSNGRVPGVGAISHHLPGYRIEAQLGRGSMGVVYLAEDVRLRRKVALKVLTPSLADDQRFRERFTRESQMAATLDHPNVIPIYSAGEEGGLLYIAMRHVDGRDLRAVVDTDSPLALERTTGIVEQVASALDAAHARGLVHRDVKPANILIEHREGQERCYLGDFGITKSLSSGGSLTATGQFVGTIDYISPEQILGKPVDGRADVYALGCVLYQCLTGVAPFSRDESAAVLWGHVHDEATPVSVLRPDLPSAVDRVVAKAMAKQPEDRYATCGELAAALRAAGGPGPVGATTAAPLVRRSAGTTGPPSRPEPKTSAFKLQIPRPPSSGSTPPQQRLWRQRWPVVLGSAAAMVLAGALVVVLVQWLGSRFPNAEEEALLREVVPSVLHRSCTRYTVGDGLGDDAQVAVRCTPGDGASEAVFARYASQAALDSAYGRAVAEAGVVPGVGDCATDPQAEHVYMREGGGTGRLLCYREAGQSFIVWTEAGSLTLMSASRDDADGAQLYQWWEGLTERPPAQTPEPEDMTQPQDPTAGSDLADPLPLPAPVSPLPDPGPAPAPPLPDPGPAPTRPPGPQPSPSPPPGPQPSPSPTDPPGPTPEEQALLNRIPADFRDTCRPIAVPEGAAGSVTASVRCTPNAGASTVVFTQFTSGSAMNAVYRGAVAVSRVSSDMGDCFIDDRAEHTYTGTRSGRVLCFPTAGGPVIAWTETQSSIMGTAVGASPDGAPLYRWWAGLVGRPDPEPPPPPSPSPPASPGRGDRSAAPARSRAGRTRG